MYIWSLSWKPKHSVPFFTKWFLKCGSTKGILLYAVTQHECQRLTHDASKRQRKIQPSSHQNTIWLRLHFLSFCYSCLLDTWKLLRLQTRQPLNYTMVAARETAFWYVSRHVYMQEGILNFDSLQRDEKWRQNKNANLLLHIFSSLPPTDFVHNGTF